MSSASFARASVLASSLRFVCMIVIASIIGVHAPGIEYAVRIEALLELPVKAHQRRGKRMKRFDARLWREAGRMAARRARDLANCLGGRLAPERSPRAAPCEQRRTRPTP